MHSILPCAYCQLEIKRRNDLKIESELFVHHSYKMPPKRQFKFTCAFCNINLKTAYSRRRHYAIIHFCYICLQDVPRKSGHRCPRQRGGGGGGAGGGRRGLHEFRGESLALGQFKLMETSLNQTFMDFALIPTEDPTGPITTVIRLFRKYKQDFTVLLKSLLKNFKNFGTSIPVKIWMVNKFTGEDIITTLKGDMQPVRSVLDINKLLFRSATDIINQLNVFVEHGSSLAVKEFPQINLKFHKKHGLVVWRGNMLPHCFKKNMEYFV